MSMPHASGKKKKKRMSAPLGRKKQAHEAEWDTRAINSEVANCMRSTAKCSSAREDRQTSFSVQTSRR